MTRRKKVELTVEGSLYPFLHTVTVPPVIAAVAMATSDICVVGNSLLLKRFELAKIHRS